MMSSVEEMIYPKAKKNKKVRRTHFSKDNDTGYYMIEGENTKSQKDTFTPDSDHDISLKNKYLRWDESKFLHGNGK